MKAPSHDEEAIIILWHDRQRSDLNAYAGSGEDALGDGSSTCMCRHVGQCD